MTKLTATIAAEKPRLRVCLRNPGCNCADADFGDKLDGDTRGGIDILEVKNQLRQVFDRIDIVVWRRRDQPHSGRGMAQARDRLVNLVPG